MPKWLSNFIVERKMSDRILIRKRIRKHIDAKGEACDFEITYSFIMHWWHQMNKAVFNGELPLPKDIIIRNFRDDSYGYCESTKDKESYILGFRREYEDRKTFLTCLVHEMVHSYEQVFHGKMSHGKTFYEWENKVKWRIGLPLGEYIDF